MTYVNISNIYKRKNIFENIIKIFGFVVNVPITHNNGKVLCTMKGVTDLLSDMRFPNVYLLCVNTDGVDFWLLKTYMTNCTEGQKPTVIVCKLNYIIPSDKSITVPYVVPDKRKNMYTTNYQGASLLAIKTLLQEYTFVGTTRLSLFGVFVKRNTFLVENCVEESANIIHGQLLRWPIVNKKFWVTAK